MPALKLHLRTTCVTCGHPIPLTSAHLPVACPTCDAASPMDAWSFYWVARERVTMRSESEGDGLLGDAQPSDVKCAACGAVVTEEAIEQGLGRGELPCGCGNVIKVRAVPNDIDRKGWWSAFVGETSRAKPAPSAAPIHFKCTNCGGALSVDGTTRTPTCSFCNTRVHLPDDLWRSLRPTPKVEPFYLWVRPAKNDDWEAQSRRAIRVPLTVVGTGTALSIVAGVAIGISTIGEEAKLTECLRRAPTETERVVCNDARSNFSGVDVFFMIFVASFIIAGVLAKLLSPKHRKA